MNRLGWLTRWHRARRRMRILPCMCAELNRRGLNVEALHDHELEAANQAGCAALASAGVRESEVTAAFVVLVQQREQF